MDLVIASSELTMCILLLHYLYILRLVLLIIFRMCEHSECRKISESEAVTLQEVTL